MQTNTLQDLIYAIKDTTGLSNASDAKIIRAVNFAVDAYSRIALLSSGTWKWDSRLNNDISRVTGTLTTSGKVSIENELATVEHVEILVNGTYKTVTPKDQRREANPLDAEYSATGTPSYYDIEGRFLRFYPLPDTSYTVRLSYGRAHPRFTTSDLTKSIGVEPIDEEFVELYASKRLMRGSNDPSLVEIKQELAQMTEDIRDMFSKRDQDTPRRLKGTIPSTFTNKSR